MSVVQPPIDDLLSRVDSRFTLCTLASKRARQINDMIHGVRDQALTVMSASDVSHITDEKPLTLSLEEIYKGDVEAAESAPAETPAGE